MFFIRGNYFIIKRNVFYVWLVFLCKGGLFKIGVYVKMYECFFYWNKIWIKKMNDYVFILSLEFVN